MRGLEVKLSTIRPSEMADLAGELDHGALHPQTDAEKRNLFLSRIRDRRNLPLDPAGAKPSGNQDPRDAIEASLGALLLDPLRHHRPDLHAAVIGDSSIADRLGEA